MKILAFHLPQFHETQENNEWWGKGFTEWTNTKKASPLFDGHRQPRIPFNENYYDLSKLENLVWQANLAKKYGIDGFCFYHYWFKGKMLLDQPAQLVYNSKEFDLEYCFSWANETWTKTWSGDKKHVLISQDYGVESDWSEHFYYLLPFFKDSRYIKYENKPVFIIYRSGDFEHFNKMIAFFQDLAEKNGLDGIYFIETLNAFKLNKKNTLFNAQLEFEPMYTTKYEINIYQKLHNKLKKIIRETFNIKSKNFLTTFDYDMIWSKIIKRKRDLNKKRFVGAFVDWDNTARKGYNAIIYKGSTPEKFHYYLEKQINVAKIINSEFLFINAWNEWAEGTYLEPDTHYSTSYLEVIKRLKNL